MAESYVRPVLSAREPKSRAWPVWRFRLVSIVILAACVLGVIQAYNYLSGASRQDPGLTEEGGLRPGLTVDGHWTALHR